VGRKNGATGGRKRFRGDRVNDRRFITGFFYLSRQCQNLLSPPGGKKRRLNKRISFEEWGGCISAGLRARAV